MFGGYLYNPSSIGFMAAIFECNPAVSWLFNPLKVFRVEIEKNNFWILFKAIIAPLVNSTKWKFIRIFIYDGG